MPNQFTLTWALGIALIIALCSGWFGWQVCDWRNDFAMADLKLTHANELRDRDAQLLQANANVQAANDSVLATIDALVRKHIEEKQHDQTEIDVLKRDVRSGAKRLSIATTGCAAAAPMPANATAAAGATEARADIDPRAGEFLITIAQRGDDATVDLNLCIDTYNVVRDKFNALGAELNKQETH